MDPGTAVYLFCCARGELLPSELELGGLEEGSALGQVRFGELVAVITYVPLGEFTGPDAEARLQDLAWLAPRALRHEEVVENIARYSPVFPTRFGTIFSTRDALEALLARHHDAIRAFLARTAGVEEWGFKGFLDRKKAQERLVEEELASGGAGLSSSPGLRYMQERRLRAEAETKVGRWLGEVSAKIQEELSSCAVEMKPRQLLSAGSTDTPGDMVLNWAFLVPKAGTEAFLAAGERLARELGSRGLAFETAGPFPPYSFMPGLDERQP
jgi:hypothetical protein